ncbi:MAG: Obg family GTPase CgtA, partial [Planctomycetes bacterium]|nr:Obg family GTPase CgtA [Planctomycetota bacterium]
ERNQEYFARNGEPGMGNNRHGKSADDVTITVPVGTQVSCKGEVLFDFTSDGETFVVAKGGKGGFGNSRYATSVNQMPDEYTEGEDGVSLKLRLELKLIADVGLLGFPNAGKSTLLSRLSAARPKIADYPFTTMQPQLGIVSSGYGHELVMADIPGIIEGAADGAGMGVEFLRHVERCRILLHLVNLCPIDGTYPLDNFHAINKELKNFSPVLASKPQLVVGNKLDLTGSDDALEWLRDEIDAPVLGISAVTGEGLKELTRELFKLLEQHPRAV